MVGRSSCEYVPTAGKLDRELLEEIRQNANLEVISRLLSQKANPNFGDSHQEKPLALAVQRNLPSVSRILLLYNADPAAWEYDGFAGVRDTQATKSEKLARAFAEGEVAIVLSSLDEIVNDAAASHDHNLLIRALSAIDAYGGNAHTTIMWEDDVGNSLLHLCAMRNADDLKARAAARVTARTLLGWGLSVNSENAEGSTPLRMAMRDMHSREKGHASHVDPAAALLWEPARTLLEGRADVDSVTPNAGGMSLLMHAAMLGDYSACELLVEFNADPLRANIDGKTAIGLAVDRPDIVLLLRSALDQGLTTPESKETKQPEGFMMCEDEHELLGSEALLNQVDLEDFYDTDWSSDVSPASPARAQFGMNIIAESSKDDWFAQDE